MPSMDSIGRKTNQSPDKVHVTGLQNINNVLSHQITILFTKSLGEKREREGGGGREGEVEGRRCIALTTSTLARRDSPFYLCHVITQHVNKGSTSKPPLYVLSCATKGDG